MYKIVLRFLTRYLEFGLLLQILQVFKWFYILMIIVIKYWQKLSIYSNILCE